MPRLYSGLGYRVIGPEGCNFGQQTHNLRLNTKDISYLGWNIPNPHFDRVSKGPRRLTKSLQ